MNIIELLKAALYGVVEGITEWLPISSTGHMLLLDEFVKLDVSTDFWNMFLVVIQLGAILAVCVLYFHELNPFSPSKGAEGRKKTWQLWGKIILACIPAAVIGLPLNDWMEDNLSSPFVIAAALIVYGIAFIIIESAREKKAQRVAQEGAGLTQAAGAPAGVPTVQRAASGPKHLARTAPSTPSRDLGPSELADEDARVKSIDELGVGTALGIGLFQVLSMVPGTSRSGSTIIGGLLLGCSRAVAAEFTFYLAVPVMVGASGLRLVKYFLKGNTFAFNEAMILLVGCAVAFVVSLVVIRFLMSYIRKHDFKAFGWYRIVLGIVVIIYFALVA